MSECPCIVECGSCIEDDRDRLRAEVEDHRSQLSEAQAARVATSLSRYGIEWQGPELPICVLMPDGYWTPWHLAAAQVARLQGIVRAVLEATGTNPEAVDLRHIDADELAAHVAGLREPHVQAALQLDEIERLREALWQAADEIGAVHQNFVLPAEIATMLQGIETETRAARDGQETTHEPGHVDALEANWEALVDVARRERDSLRTENKTLRGALGKTWHQLRKYVADDGHETGGPQGWVSDAPTEALDALDEARAALAGEGEAQDLAALLRVTQRALLYLEDIVIDGADVDEFGGVPGGKPHWLEAPLAAARAAEKARDEEPVEWAERPLLAGDYVRFNSPHGSTGKIVLVREQPPFDQDPIFYVEWVFGRDKAGKVMTACPGGKRAKELVRITEAEYIAVRDRRPGDGQCTGCGHAPHAASACPPKPYAPACECIVATPEKASQS